MTLRAFVLLTVFVALFGFIGLNWTSFSAPSTLSFGFAVAHVPVGFVMFGALVIMVRLGIATTQRQLADEAEASRIADVLARVNITFPQRAPR